MLAAALVLAGPSTLPNIVLVLADDLGYGDLGCYGQRDIQTPVLDQLAKGGRRYTQAYSGSTVCAPSRDSLLTGHHTGHGWMRGNGSIALRPDPEHLTLATRLREAGYATAMIGKSSVACNGGPPTWPNAKGFDHFYGQLTHTGAHDHYPEQLTRNGVAEIVSGNIGKGRRVYDHDLYLREALQWMGQDRAKPFFLMYAATIPHASLAVPDRWFQQYKGKFSEKPFHGGHYDAAAEPKATYAAMVSRLDWEVGQLLEKLTALGKRENTLVIFTSDNGGMSEGGYHYRDLKSCGDLRGGKRDLYEGGVRVPLIAAWPNQIPAGTVSDRVVASWDLTPTFAELTRRKAPRGLDGISFASDLRGNRQRPRNTPLYWEFHEMGGKRAVRFGDWKAVQVDVGRAKPGPVELYDLSRDPSETLNVAREHRAEVAKAVRLFGSSRTSHPVFNFGPVTSGHHH